MKHKANKKVLRRILSLILVMTMLVTGLNLDVMAESVYAAQKQEEKYQKTKEKVTVVKELIGERTENSNTYLMSDGSKKLEILGENIRYEENGKLKDYNTSLSKINKEDKNELKNTVAENHVDEFHYVNASGDSKQYFPDEFKDGSEIVMSKDKYSLSFSLCTDKEGIFKAKVSNDEIRYVATDENVEYQYVSLRNGIKENIVLSSRPETNEFKYLLKGKNIVYKMLGSGEISIEDKKTKKQIGKIVPPNIVDNEGHIDYTKVKYELENNDGNIFLKIVVDNEYLDAENTKYPLTVDPTAVWFNTKLPTTIVNSITGRSDDVVLTNTLLVENNYIYNEEQDTRSSRVYIDTANLIGGTDWLVGNPEISGKYIENSYLYLGEKEASKEYVQVDVKSVESAWDVNTITWSTQPQISNETIATTWNKGVDGRNHGVNITKWVQAIADGEKENHGLVLEAAEEGTQCSYYGTIQPGNNFMCIDVIYRDFEQYDASIEATIEYDNETGKVQTSIEDTNVLDEGVTVKGYKVFARKNDGNKFVSVYQGTNIAEGAEIDIDSDCSKIDYRVCILYSDGKVKPSNIISFEKTTEISEDEEGKEITTVSYGQTRFDTDGDGLGDGYEIWDFKTLWNTETRVDAEGNKIYDLDTDKDGFTDSYEVFTLGTDPAVANEEGEDSDGDGWTDLKEYQEGTDPWLKDSDFDGTNDRADETPRRTDEGENVVTVAQATRTSQTQAAAAIVNKGLYDKEYSEIIDGVTYTYIKNIYRDYIKKVYADYGDIALNKTIKYFYDERGNNTAIVESYDESYDPKHTQTICITYTYDKDNNVIFICDQKTKYTMNYDTNGKMIGMNIGNQNIMSYADSTIIDNTVEGDDSNINVGDIIDQRQDVSTYGNQQSVKTVTTTYKINDNDTSNISNQKAREVKIYYNNSVEASYVMEYNNEGNLISVSDYSVDKDNPTVINYTYTETGTVASMGEDFTSRILTEEDEENNSYTTTKTYTYKSLSGNSKTHTDSSTVSTETESLDSGGEKREARVQQTFINGDNLSESISENSFEKILHSNKYNTNVVKSTYEKTEAGASLNLDIYASNEDKDIDYSYDLAGNITNISINKQIKYEYEYDAHGRLITETDYVDSKKYSYDYNTTGNLRAKTQFNLNSEGKTESGDDGTTIRYAYGNGEWPDQLTTYNGQSITYDSVGNPLTYINGLQFTWSRGRQLSQIVTENNEAITYRYNQNGLRQYKDTPDTMSEYYWEDNVLIRETVTYKASKQTCDIWYIYDAGGEIIGYQYTYVDLLGKERDVTIYYEKNVQGDVIGLLDARGAEIATYTYDAWGNITSSSYVEGNEIPYELNHITYRGYYRDNETGFYYLQSRYYDAEIGRFINADDVKYLGNSGTVWGYNLYTYCEANPVNCIDPQGTAAITLSFLGIIFVVAAVVYTCAVITSPRYRKSWSELCNSAVKGIVNSLRGIGLAVNWVSAKTKEITKALENSFARANPMTIYRWNKELHHIVAKGAHNAQYARAKLKTVDIEVNDKRNLVWIKTGLHRRLHTNLYYGFANSVVISAYNRGYNYKTRKDKVLTALKTLRAFIEALDRAAPF